METCVVEYFMIASKVFVVIIYIYFFIDIQLFFILFYYDFFFERVNFSQQIISIL